MGSWRYIIYTMESEADGFETQEEARDKAVAYRKILQRDNPSKEYYFETDQDGAEYED